MRGHVLQRGKKWAFVIDVGADGSGKRRQRWHSGYRTKREAEAALGDVLGTVRKGSYVETSRQTLAQYLKEWLASIKPTIRHSTWSSYAMQVETQISPHLGGTALQSLTAAQLNDFFAELLKSGRRDGKGGLSARTVGYVRMILRKALADAVRWQLLARNVADQTTAPRVGASLEMRTWTAGELRQFLEGASEDRLYAAWLLAATTGMRRGEVLGLRWRDVDFETARVAVTQTLVSVGWKVSLSTPKTAQGRRLVALDATTVAILRAHRTRQLEERLAAGPAYQDQDLAFALENGAPLHPESFSGAFETLVKQSELPRIRLHDLRHTHATLALQAGVHPKVVSERLGHANIAITLDTYSHAIPAMQEEAAAKVAAVVFGA